MSVRRKTVYRYRQGSVRAPLPKSARLMAGVAIAAAVVTLGIVLLAAPKPRPAPPSLASYSNPLAKRTIGDLEQFGNWLQREDVKGFIGEFGWPQDKDTEAWNDLANNWYKAADSYDVWTTAWAAGSWWEDYPLALYASKDGKPGLDAAGPGAAIVERHLTNKFHDRRGINLAGMEFGTNFPGRVGTDYFYEPGQSFAFLADRGIKTVRLPFRWERVQPNLGGPLDEREVAAIRVQLDAAHKNGIGVILDLHNYGAYIKNGTEYHVGDGQLTEATLVDVWLRLSQAFKDHPAVIGYGIMNEPHDLPQGTYASAAKHWEAISQAVVSGLRAHHDTMLVMVPGYDWSSLRRWTSNHPRAWIKDPAHTIRYEAHHYWDSDGSGTYARSFADETALAQNTP